MALNANVASTWKELTAHGRADAWKDIVEGFQNVEGVWTVIYSSGALIGFSDYPYPIPVMAGWKYRVGDTGDWVKVTEDGEINTSGTFTGVVRAKSVLTLNEWYSEEGIGYGDTVKVNGTSLSTARDKLTSFANGGKGYVCGGYSYSSAWGTSYHSTVDVYDSSGNRTTGTSLTLARYDLTSFVNNSKGYVCGGYSDNGYANAIDEYDSVGNHTSGRIQLFIKRSSATSFVNNSKGYVCGGNASGVTNTTVDVIDSAGNRTTGTSLSVARYECTSFANGGKGYVCGGTGYTNAVEIYDSAGNRTTGTSLSVGRNQLTSFVNNSKGYVCGGYNGSSVQSTVDVYDLSGNRTTGTSLSVARNDSTSFVYNLKGYVCGGYSSQIDSTVDVYDSSGNRTTAPSLSVVRRTLTSFANGNKGYVCGGRSGTNAYTSAVDIYYDEEFPYTIAKIPITAGSTYTLNGISGTAPTSEVLTFDEKVTGTIKYKDGDLYPSLDITVYDEDGTVAVGADIVIEKVG